MKKKKLIKRVAELERLIKNLNEDVDILLDGTEFEKELIRCRRQFNRDLMRAIWGV
jgi:hypothetical protein